MDNRDTVLSARFSPPTTIDPFLELDLRDFSANMLLGRRGQLRFTTKLVFKAEDSYRKEQSVFQIWADVQVSGQDGVLSNLGRATMPDPIFFGPGSGTGGRRDPWTRVFDLLTINLDYRQLDEIEQKRRGGPLTFIFTVGGIVHHGGKIAALYPANHHLTYDISASDWIRVLTQLGYGTYLSIEVPLTMPNGLTGDVQQAARALQEAQAALQRGDYEEATADCRPGIEALERADKGKFNLKPWEHSASKGERFYWLQRALLSVTHAAHHPNDPALASDTAPGSRPRWERADAEAAIAILAALIRQRIAR